MDSNKNTKAVVNFDVLYDNCSDELKLYVDEMKDIKQSPEWHPEGNVFIHTKIVTDRIANEYNDINLTLAAFFHDMGKVITTEWNSNKGTWSAYGHEIASAKMMEDFIGLINKFGGDFSRIKFIVQNHMRFKFLDEFRIQEQVNFLTTDFFSDVHKFSSADYGGTDTTCKPLKDISAIQNEIDKYKEIKRLKKLVAEKFNGTIVMELYPTLRGKELGDAISSFKNTKEDFVKYVLETTQEEVLTAFNTHLGWK